MVNSVLEQYTVSDLLEWYQSKRLKLNPDFQRRSVWTQSAKIYLIDTILRHLPIPKIYLRVNVDLETRQSYREIVDGQQRLRAIFEFSEDRLPLSRRAGEFSGHRYSTLDDDQKEAFLTYPMAVEQLINASDSDVLEIFSRLNSYTIPLNAQELRHGKYQGDFKWAVHNTAQQWSVLWDTYKVVSVRERLRMADDQLMAEMFSIVINGVTDGGKSNIDKLYVSLENEFPQQEAVTNRVGKTLSYIAENFSPLLTQTSIKRSPHFLILFAAIAHALFGIPAGGIGSDTMPTRDEEALSDVGMAYSNLSELARILDMDEQEALQLPPALYQFWFASSGTTQRILSRKSRFITYHNTLLPREI